MRWNSFASGRECGCLPHVASLPTTTSKNFFVSRVPNNGKNEKRWYFHVEPEAFGEYIDDLGGGGLTVEEYGRKFHLS